MNSAAAISDIGMAQMISQPGQLTNSRIVGHFHAWCVDRDGQLEWDIHQNNALTNEGANWIRDIMFKAAVAVGTDVLHIGLASAAILATATLAAGVTEQTGGAYARKPVTTANWNSASQGQANNNAAPASWTASGTQMAGVTELFVCNVLSGTAGKLLSHATLTGGPYTVNVSSTLNVTYSWTIS